MANIFNAAKAAPVLTAAVLAGTKPFSDLEQLAKQNDADAIKLPAEFKGKQPESNIRTFVGNRTLPAWAVAKAARPPKPRPCAIGNKRNAKPKVTARKGLSPEALAAHRARFGNAGAFQKPEGTGVKTGGGTKTNDPNVQRALRASMKGSGGGGKKKGD